MNDDLKCPYCSNEKPLGFSFIMETRMQIDEHIDLFSPYKLTDEDVYVVSGKDLKEALSLAEKSRWKSPHKAEFPDDYQPIFYIAHGQNTFRTGIKKGSMLVENSTGKNYRFNIVKYWTYAPVLDAE